MNLDEDYTGVCNPRLFQSLSPSLDSGLDNDDHDPKLSLRVCRRAAMGVAWRSLDESSASSTWTEWRILGVLGGRARAVER